MIRKPTWIILLIFLVLLAAVLLWQRQQDQKVAQATPTTAGPAERQYLFDVEGEIASLRIERVGDKSVELLRDEAGKWSLVGSPDTPLDNAALDTLADSLAAMPLVSTLQNIPEMEALGLNPPSYRILVVLQSGSQLIASVGKNTPTGSGYYVLAGDRRVYIVNEFSLQSVLDLVDNQPYLPTPSPSPAEITPQATSVP